MLEIGKFLQGKFNSWDELMESFCRGAEYDTPPHMHMRDG